MIVDKQEFDKFVDFLPELQNDEVFFISLSARNKYLTDEERIKFGLGRTKMFSREIARDKAGLYIVMSKLKASLQYRKTKIGAEIPEKALVVYINVNPSSMVKAYELFSRETLGEIEMIHSALLNNKQGNYEYMKRLPTKLNNAIQKSRSRKIFIDIDCDVSDFETIKPLESKLVMNHVNYKIIKTQGGYHFLIKKETLNDSLKLHELVAEAHIEASKIGGEVKFNTHHMVPAPGTLQAKQLVVIK